MEAVGESLAPLLCVAVGASLADAGEGLIVRDALRGRRTWLALPVMEGEEVGLAVRVAEALRERRLAVGVPVGVRGGEAEAVGLTEGVGCAAEGEAPKLSEAVAEGVLEVTDGEARRPETDALAEALAEALALEEMEKA